MWRVTTTEYEYRLLDHDERELLVFHWQPGPTFAGPDYPHLHVSASLSARLSTYDEQDIDLDKLHIPTSRIALEAVVRMLVSEFGIKARHDDWQKRLARTEKDFRQRRTQFD
ncbi:MAG: hypothetical protein M3Q71_24095 [Chloroflexota bacterium]|nr:hypothetical protein [Chloroflexota bacterium]